jgi:hypothetical protein
MDNEQAHSIAPNRSPLVNVLTTKCPSTSEL